MSNPNCPIGHNRLAQMAPEFAARCQFQNPNLHKAHGKRALGIRMLSNSSVSELMKLRASRHSNLKSHARWYQRINDENIEKKYEAMNPSLLDDSPKCDDTHQSLPTTPSPQEKNSNFLTPSSSNPPQTYKQNIVTPSFDQNNCPQPPNQAVINIDNSNYCHLSPYFA